MVKAIDFAVRTGTGTVVRGAVAGEGGSEFLQVGSGEAVSLNLSQSSVVGYERQGKNLIVKLSDGREIVLNGYFESNPGEDNKLYLSSNGEISEVYLTDGGNGTMYANYGAADTWNKYSQLDDLRFTDDPLLAGAEVYSDDQVGMGAFVPGLLGLGGGGLGAAAAVVGGIGVIGGVGGGGGGGGGTTRIPPAVDQPESTNELTTNTVDPQIVVTGTGEPGDDVEVVIGDETQTTEIEPDGTWQVTFPGTDLPVDGTHETVVTVTTPEGTETVLDGPTFVIDMHPPEVVVTEGTESAGDIENLADYADGVRIAGTGETGATIDVKIGEITHTTTVVNGQWSVVFTQTEVAGGDYHTLPVSVTATDAMGNKTVLSETLVVDTVPYPVTINSVATDNVVNGGEAGGAIVVSGTSTAGVTVRVSLGGVDRDVVTGTDGTWSTTYAAGTFTGNDGERTLTASTMDAAGNPNSIARTLLVDTSTTVSFSDTEITSGNVVNNAEAGQPITFTGQAEAGSRSVTVEWNGTTLPATVSGSGSWTVTFPAGTAPMVSGTGSVTSTATVTAIDGAGNTGTDIRTFQIDRATSAAIDVTQATDNVISGAEATSAGGVRFTGTAEAGAQVEVTFNSITRTVEAQPNGTWSAAFTSAELPRGTETYVIGVKSTDLAGNVSASVTHSVLVDTEVRDFTLATIPTGADAVVNNAEAANGLLLTGTVEAGATGVAVMFGSAGPFAATINGTTWSLRIPEAALPDTEASVALSATATDRYGNVSAPITQMVEFDRIVAPFTRSGGRIGGDGILNADEVASGLDLNGTGEVGATVVVTLSNGSSQEMVVGANGLWNVRFEPGQLPTGEGGPQINVTVSATDLAGNTASFSERVTIDTVAADSPTVTNIIKSTSGAEGLTGVFLDETIDSGFSFHRVDADGNQSRITLANGSIGSDLARFSGSTVPEGDYLVINHDDAAGNGSATLFVTNNTGTSMLDLGNTAFQSFDFTTLDLTLAQTTMTISAQDLIAMTGPDSTLTIKGGTDDQITLQGGAVAVDQAAAPAGYTLYTLGGGAASVLLNDDIQTVI